MRLQRAETPETGSALGCRRLRGSIRSVALLRYNPIDKEVVSEVKEASTAMEKYRVSVADEERVVLESLVSKGKAAVRRIAHARILWRADKGHEDQDSASALESSSPTACRVRKRLVTEGFLAAVGKQSVLLFCSCPPLRGVPTLSSCPQTDLLRSSVAFLNAFPLLNY